MPKERLLDEFAGCIAEVTWAPERHVQLATLHTDVDTFVAWCRGIVAEADALKRNEGTNVPHVSDVGRLSDGTSMGVFWTPNRHQINQLIRNLRRARNAAYGADE